MDPYPGLLEEGHLCFRLQIHLQPVECHRPTPTALLAPHPGLTGPVGHHRDYAARTRHRRRLEAPVDAPEEAEDATARTGTPSCSRSPSFKQQPEEEEIVEDLIRGGRAPTRAARPFERLPELREPRRRALQLSLIHI